MAPKTEPAVEHPPEELGVSPPESRSVLAVLFGLTGFAIAQPLLSLAGANPALFVFRNVSRSELVGLAVAIAFVPPLLTWLAVRLAASVRPSLGMWLYRVVVAALALVSGTWVGREAGMGIGAVGLGVIAAASAVYAITNSPTATHWLRYTAILPFVALGLFLFGSESSALLRNADSVERGEISGDPPSVVFLMLDELPTLSLLADDGTIDEVRFPNFDRLAGGSDWYRNFTTLSQTTETAIPTMMTGHDPKLDAPLWTNYPDNLFSMLAPTHGLTVDESFTKLCGVSTCGTEGPSQDTRAESQLRPAVDDLFGLWTDRLRGVEGTRDSLADFEESTEVPSIDVEGPGFSPSDDYVQQWPSRFSDFVASLAPSEDPTFYYLHLLLPHYPWQWYPDGQLYAAPPDPAAYFNVSSGTTWGAALEQERHLLQLQYVDELLGELLTTLEDRGMYDETAIVVTADHGVAFEVPERRDMDGLGRSETAFVPLFVKRPGQRDGQIDDRNLMTVDLLPLVADLVGVDVPFEVDGLGPDDPGIAARGNEKYYFSLNPPFDPTSIEGPRTFDGSTERPSAPDRAIRSSKPGDTQLGPLLELLDRSEEIGKPVSTLGLDRGGAVSVLGLDALLENNDVAASVFVQGAVTDDSTPVEVLVAVDGVVVSGSPVETTPDGSVFIAMLPSSAKGPRQSIEIILVDAGGDMTLAEVD